MGYSFTIMVEGSRDITQICSRKHILRRQLLGWYAQNKRSLPWRDVDDPYKTLVSEFMLQQTQVTTVLPHFEGFIKAFPTLHHLAAAPSDKVLATWSGLGYYRRARNLQATAQAVQREHGGELPQSVPDLKRLPGVGDYTARALASLVHDLPEAVVDGNVIRVLTRMIAWEKPVTTAESKKHLQTIADALVAPKKSGDWNQAMMELGATVCTPKNPNCPTCPWAGYCAAYKAARPESFPVKGTPARSQKIIRAVAVYRDRGKYFLIQRKTGAQLQGSWEFPGVDMPSGARPKMRLKKYLQELFEREVNIGQEIADAVHSITTKRIHIRAYKVSQVPGEITHTQSQWVTKPKLGTLFVSSMTKKILDQLD